MTSEDLTQAEQIALGTLVVGSSMAGIIGSTYLYLSAQESRNVVGEEKQGLSIPSSTSAQPKLTKVYAGFCVFETISINLVGMCTLLFQNELAAMIHPGRSAKFEEESMYQFWIHHDPLAFNNRKEYCLGLMLAGWIMLAGLLQAALNFDARVSIRAKQYALYTFFLCDLYWLVLSWYFCDVIHQNHIIGSLLTIAVRFYFVMAGPSACFVQDDSNKNHQATTISSPQPRLVAFSSGESSSLMGSGESSTHSAGDEDSSNSSSSSSLHNERHHAADSKAKRA